MEYVEQGIKQALQTFIEFWQRFKMYKEYEEAKQELIKLNLNYEEYQKFIIELAEVYGI